MGLLSQCLRDCRSQNGGPGAVQKDHWTHQRGSKTILALFEVIAEQEGQRTRQSRGFTRRSTMYCRYQPTQFSRDVVLILLQAFDFIAAVHDPKSIPEDTAKAVREFFGARNDVHCSQMLVENYMASLEASGVSYNH